MEVGEKELDHALPWDTIRPALYRKSNAVETWLPQLTEQSIERRKANPEFQNFLNRRDRLSERYESKTVSLLLADRLAEAEAELELDELQESSFQDEENDSANDLTLTETLHILTDWIDLEERTTPALLAPAF
jgi:carboxyl-terminal processing protease